MCFGDQAGLDGIEVDITFRRREMIVIPDKSIPVIVLPKCSGPADFTVRFSRREALPRTDDRAERLARKNREENVHVVRHDRPRVQAVTHAVEGEESIFDNSSDLIGPQPAGAPSLVEQFVPHAFRPCCTMQLGHRFLRQAIHKPERHKLDNVLRVEVREISA
jgi:hypothetical protein